jgi:hypothetical protein
MLPAEEAADLRGSTPSTHPLAVAAAQDTVSGPAPQPTAPPTPGMI